MSQDAAVLESETGSAPDRSLTIEGGLAGGYVLRRPVSVTVWEEGAEIVVDAPDLDLHAFGDDTDAAVMHLRARIVAHLERLEELGERLAPRLRDQRQRLRDLPIAPGA